MILARARVVAVAEGSVWVESNQRSSCAACSANNGCGAAILARVLGQRCFRMRAVNHLPLRVGDEVVVGVDAHAILRGSFAVYLAPLLMFLLGAGLGSFLFPSSEGMSILSGIIGLIAGILWLQLFSRRIRFDTHYQSMVLERVTVRTSSDCVLSS